MRTSNGIWTVTIDPGHGGRDPGAVHGGIREADIAFEVAGHLGRMLEEKEVQVRFTHRGLPADQRVGNPERVARAAGSGVFISIHCNAFTLPTAHGTETFFWRNDQGHKLARRVQVRLQGLLRTANRGVKERRFTVLVQNRPAILVELAFLSNPQDRQLLITRQEDMAAAIAQGYWDWVKA